MENPTNDLSSFGIKELREAGELPAEKKYNARLYPYRKKIADIEEED